ncbi:thioredoxin [Prosthecomicrobium pneumaticum]|uniref:Thioredoxin n=1 Tax=Prosthecomicrobium pneumaticum TaxID=81895 RepID=A0A7W9FMW1_9HYPH|nr:thioredoxin [Prosthecomicrobium pneumaticum]MBB5753640.1 putative thioredoxin [Prosthecomicrobium pneumaticum]
MSTPAEFLSAAPATPGGEALVIDVTTASFTRDVLEESRRRPVLVDFWATWCGPCKQLGPVIEKVVKEKRGAVLLAKMDIDKHPQVAGQLGIQSIPAVIAFVDGRPVDGFMGALPESQVRAFIDRIGAAAGPTDEAAAIEEALAEGEALIAEGAAEDAAELYGAILARVPEEIRAIAGLARAHLVLGRLDEARETLALVPAEKENDAAVAAVRAQLALAEQTAGLGEEGELRARIARDPKDHQARFDLALLLNANGDREGATDALLDIFAADRMWEDEKARKQLLQFFEAWGPMDEATRSGRRRLSSLLFA